MEQKNEDLIAEEVRNVCSSLSFAIMLLIKGKKKEFPNLVKKSIQQFKQLQQNYISYVPKSQKTYKEEVEKRILNVQKRQKERKEQHFSRYEREIEAMKTKIKLLKKKQIKLETERFNDISLKYKDFQSKLHQKEMQTRDLIRERKEKLLDSTIKEINDNIETKKKQKAEKIETEKRRIDSLYKMRYDVLSKQIEEHQNQIKSLMGENQEIDDSFIKQKHQNRIEFIAKQHQMEFNEILNEEEYTLALINETENHIKSLKEKQQQIRSNYENSERQLVDFYNQKEDEQKKFLIQKIKENEEKYLEALEIEHNLRDGKIDSTTEIKDIDDQNHINKDDIGSNDDNEKLQQILNQRNEIIEKAKQEKENYYREIIQKQKMQIDEMRSFIADNQKKIYEQARDQIHKTKDRIKQIVIDRSKELKDITKEILDQFNSTQNSKIKEEQNRYFKTQQNLCKRMLQQWDEYTYGQGLLFTLQLMDKEWKQEEEIQNEENDININSPLKNGAQIKYLQKRNKTPTNQPELDLSDSLGEFSIIQEIEDAMIYLINEENKEANQLIDSFANYSAKYQIITQFKEFFKKNCEFIVNQYKLHISRANDKKVIQSLHHRFKNEIKLLFQLQKKYYTELYNLIKEKEIQKMSPNDYFNDEIYFDYFKYQLDKIVDDQINEYEQNKIDDIRMMKMRNKAEILNMHCTCQKCIEMESEIIRLHDEINKMESILPKRRIYKGTLTHKVLPSLK